MSSLYQRKNPSAHLREEVVHSEKWLRLTKLHYIDENQVERQWDCCERTTRKGDVDGVEMIARVVYGGNREDEIVLVIQYRPPIRSYCVEFPAGLCDPDETVEQTALRELKEECGFVAKVLRVSPILGLEVGLTSANAVTVTLEIDGNAEENKNPQVNQQDEEQIEVLLVPVSQMLSTLQRYSQENKYYVDAKLWTFAEGLSWYK